MRASLQRRLLVAMGIPLFVGLLTAGYILSKFRGYEDSASHVMSGDQHTVIQGRLIEARVSAALEQALGSTNSEEANSAFRDRLVAISDDLKGLSRDHSDRNLDEARRQISGLIAAKAEPVEDLFVQYRNVKTTAFNLYRQAWASKWLTVAHNVGLIINDLDNLPYHAGERAAASVYSKIAPLIALIAHSPIPQEGKLNLFSQLNTLKVQVGQYSEATKKADAMKTARGDDLKALASTLKKYNDQQGKGMMQFGNEARTEVFKSIIAFFLFILFAMGWWAFAAKRFQSHVEGVVNHIKEQFEGWISTSGNITAGGFNPPEKADSELAAAYRAMDQSMRRMNAIRKEDILVKRLLSVPIVLVNRGKQAIFWNSALSILGRVRALEETGPIDYNNLLRFTSVQGKVVDPIDKAFVENKEITQLALLRVGQEGVAVQATCTPVLGPDHQTEYVMVNIRDLRDENRRSETELDRQLECVRSAIEFVKAGKIPPDPGPTLRRPVVQSIEALKAHAHDIQEKAGVMAGQVDTMRGRMTREAGLKKNVHSRMEQVRDEIKGVRDQVASLGAFTEKVTERVGEIETRGKILYAEYEDIRKRACELARNLKQSQTLVSSCLERLMQTEEISGRVRSNERLIKTLLEKSTVLNANNSILGSKRELTPTDVVTITENITQLMNQFDRGYRFIEQSVGDVEQGLADLSGKLHSSLKSCVKLTTSDQDLVRSITESEKLVSANLNETGEFTRELARLRGASAKLGDQINSVEGKLKSLVQIGQASIDLQNQLELGFDGMFGAAAAAQSANLGGSA